MIFNPFSINTKTSIPLHDDDLDVQFFNEVCHPCVRLSDYYLEDKFNEKLSKVSSDDGFSLMHVNIRSLPAHIVEFEAYLALICHQLSFIGISVTWLTYLNESIHCVGNYNHVSRQRTVKSCGGVSIFIKSNIPDRERPDLFVMK